MRTLIRFSTFLLTASLLASLAQAQSDISIAVIDQERVLFGSDAAQAASSELRQQFGGQEEQVRQLEQQITEMRERGESEQALMSDDEVEELQQEIQFLLQQRQQLVQQLQNAQQERRRSFVEEYEGQLTQILEEIIEEEGIDLLISTDEVLYARPDLDITEEALNRFNDLVGGN
ncbi:OmpH family outer membrane protein [Natronospirillum operosum]|uniref:OmpH family outer membrane protein n=1 Tax=Natronospirillum operosum TaxID=2759953 RepID=A0A4Z0WET0_9GAMM|nr:OmpH family outer membrane protein [Natronospirillum operosum]TGG95128.1 OmpH family outer membrane protein [Natronospirillum operosum]